MSVQITALSVLKSAATLATSMPYKTKLATFKGKYSCATNKQLLEFMSMQVIVDENISISTGSCECLKGTFDFTQDCAPVTPITS